MAEKINRIRVQAFRGVPESFELLLDGKSCLIYGENGSGKSTISDALEWYFRHRVEFLAREGREAGLRHFGSDNNLTTSVYIETQGEATGTVTREKGPPTAALGLVQNELFLLRGHNLAEFIDRGKADKWKALVSMLGLEDAQELRQDLGRVKRDLKQRKEEATEQLRGRESAVRAKVGDPSRTSVQETLREKSTQVGVDPPERLEDVTDPQWLLRKLPSSENMKRHAKLSQLRSDLEGIREISPDLQPLREWNQSLTEDSSRISLKLKLHEVAISLFEESGDLDICPLCGQSVDSSELTHLVSSALESLKEASQGLERAREAARATLSSVERVDQKRHRLVDDAKRNGMELPGVPACPAPRMKQSLDSTEALTVEDVQTYLEEVTQWDQHADEQLSDVGGPSGNGADPVAQLQDLVTDVSSWLQASKEKDNLTTAYEWADRAETAYGERLNEYIDAVLSELSGDISYLYGKLHPGEPLGKTGLGTWGKGVEIEVEFYGINHQPPHRVLSESHLNSLAITVFLAMARRFNQRTGFIVLDDVVNSFDINHRAALAKLLTSEMEGLQLIVLTHDPSFYSRLRSLNPDWKALEFIGWTYEEGPQTKTYVGDRFLAEAWEAFERDDKSGAAQKGRRALEEILLEACERVEAPLAFRRGYRNERREAEELLNGMRRELKGLPKSYREEIKQYLDLLSTDLQAALNVEVHAGEEYAAKAEVYEALGRVSGLISRWTCESCQTRVWYGGGSDRAYCRCGALQHPPVEHDLG